MMSNKKGGDRISKTKRGFLQISFGWLFAMIIGAIILFFAVYASVRLINTEEKTTATEAGKEIAVLLNPLETGFGEEKTTPMTVAVESRINNRCSEFGNFGEQEISVSQKSRGEWTESGLSQIFYNKYIFSGDFSEGRNFYLFSKPFNFPFKVADLIFLTSSQDTYCFADAPEEIREELASLGQGNILIGNCTEESVNVCFGGNNCDINVNTRDNSVEKTNGETVYYETDALMYAAIFSNSEIYECQVKRLMKRLESLALIYDEKETILSGVGCIAEINVLPLASAASSLEDSSELIDVNFLVENAENENKQARSCKIW